MRDLRGRMLGCEVDLMHRLAVYAGCASALLFFTAGCPAPPQKPQPKESGKFAAQQRPCPAEAPAPPALPGHRPEHNLAEFWLSRMEQPEKAVLAPAAIAAHNERMFGLEKEGYPVGRFDLLRFQRTAPQVRHALAKRLTALEKMVKNGKWVAADGSRADNVLTEVRKHFQDVKPVREFRAAHRGADIRCFPTAKPLYEKAWDESFDMVQCSRLRQGEPVQVVARAPGFFYVFAPYAEGWVAPEALTPPLSEDQARAMLQPEDFVVVQADRMPVWAKVDGRDLLGMVRLGLRLPLLTEPPTPGGRVRVALPTTSGISQGWLDMSGASLSLDYPKFSRAAVISRALTMLGTPYGWGGVGGTRDCSRFMMDLMGAFGLLLPRNSWMQSRSGVRQVDVSKLDDEDKERAIEQAAEDAVVLLYMKGHIMLFVGRDGDDLFAFHLFSGYLVPCGGGAETMMRANRALVSTLELGRGSSRKAFIQRISTLVLLGGTGEEGGGE